MIETGKTSVPWRMVLMMAVPFGILRMGDAASHQFLPFTLRKFTDDPALITFIISMDIAISMIFAPFVAWKSDRIWTRIGRRKPFVLLSMLGAALVLPFLPFTGSLLIAALTVSAYNFFGNLNLYELLYMEVVPPPQRGRASSMRQGAVLLAGLYMNLFLFANFDSVTAFEIGGHSFSINGEMVAYFTIASLLFFAMMLLVFSVREVAPVEKPASNEHFSIRLLLRSTFLDRQLLKIYLLLFAIMAMGFGTQGLGGLMLTEQFGYSKSSMGKMYSILQVLQFVIALPLAGYLSDRVDRVKLFLAGISISTLFPITYWLWIHFVAENNIPSIPAIMFFTGADHLVDFTAHIAVMPLAFDYIPRARMGTFVAGSVLAKGCMKLLMGNAVGLFVKYYSKIFCPNGVGPNRVPDYSSLYLFLFFIGCLGIASAVYFLRERAAGRVIPFGKLEHEAAVNAKKLKEAERAPVVAGHE